MYIYIYMYIYMLSTPAVIHIWGGCVYGSESVVVRLYESHETLRVNMSKKYLSTSHLSVSAVSIDETKPQQSM